MNPTDEMATGRPGVVGKVARQLREGEREADGGENQVAQRPRGSRYRGE